MKKRESKNLPKLTPEELKRIRLNNGEIVIVADRDETVWTKTDKEKKMVSDAKSNHKALLRSQGVNHKKHMNI